MPLSKSLETKVRSAVNVLSRQGEDITRKSIKRELELSEDEWKQHKSAIMEHAQSVLDELPSSPAKPSSSSKKKQEKKTKYDRAADKNLNTFMSMVAGSMFADEEAAADDIDASPDPSIDQDEDGASIIDDDTPPPKKKQKKSHEPTKKGQSSFKSAEFVDDSDDEQTGTGPVASVSTSTAPKKQKKAKVAKATSKDKAGSSKSSKSKEPKGKAKVAEEWRGDEKEEAEIKRLKGLISAANGPRPFDRTTGAERTLTVQARLDRLKQVLTKLGLTTKTSLKQAQKVGEERALTKELEEIQGVPKVEGLRDGKKRKNQDKDEDDEEEGEGQPARVPKAKAFAAFLGDQSSDSE